MSLPKYIEDGDLVRKDPDSSEIHMFDWDVYLPAGLTITVSAFSFTLWRYVGDEVLDAAALISLSKSGEVIDPTTSRKTQYMATGGTLGARFVVNNRVTLSDGQIYDASYHMLIQ